MKIVLDSCLLLAFLRKEQNWQKVKNYLKKAKGSKVEIFFCWINLVEVYYKIYRKKDRNAADKILSIIRNLPLRLVFPDEDLFIEAARVKGKYAIALSDCFIAALAKKLKAQILTGDPDFKMIEKEIKIIWLRK